MIEECNYASLSGYGMSESITLTLTAGPKYKLPLPVPTGTTGMVAPDCKIKVLVYISIMSFYIFHLTDLNLVFFQDDTLSTCI